MHLVIARTMEIFCQLGIADELRSKGSKPNLHYIEDFIR